MKRLHHAWNHGDRIAFDAVCMSGGNVPDASETNVNGRTALWLAAATGSTVGINLMLGKGADLEFRCPATGYTPLQAATFWANLDAVRLLLERHANPDARDAHLQTALMRASLDGRVEFAQLLLQFGANVDLQDAHGTTALMMAAARHRAPIVKLLLAARAGVNAQNETGATALMWSGNVESLRLLLEAGADQTILDREGKSVRDRMKDRPQLLALLGPDTKG